MTARNLAPLLHPRTIAVIGGSARVGSLGARVLDNLVDGGWPGPLFAVNPHRVDRPGITWAARISDLPQTPDLAIITAPADQVPAAIAALGARGTRCAVVLSAGLTKANGLQAAMLEAAKPNLLRIVGPNCLGIMMPGSRVDATFASNKARPGRLALISQSGALITAILDWAAPRNIGFSGIVSAGDMADVDLGDLIDMFAVDPQTDAILLYVEGVTHAAKFMAAASAAARVKPVIAIKAGKSAAAAKATMSHTGALAGSYDVYRAAFARAGIVMVETLTELLDAAEVLCMCRPALGNALGIVTNGGGAAILAVDALASAEASLATLSSSCLGHLDRVLPPTWSHANPVDIIGDAGSDRYRDTVRTVLNDPAVDALLVMNCPTGLAKPAEVAEAVANDVLSARKLGNNKPVLACWLGEGNAAAVRGAFERAGIPTYNTPDDAVRSFGYLMAAQRARRMLTDAPAMSRDMRGDVAEARRIIEAARAESRDILNEIEAKQLLRAYQIPTVETRHARSAQGVREACEALTPPYAIKIVSPDISHKSDAGGVVLNLPDPAAAVAAACAMQERIHRAMPSARLQGFAVEEMCIRPHAYELLAGIFTDAAFGPMLMVGAGGTAVEILNDKALGLPPIDHAASLRMIGATRIAKLLAGYRAVPAVDVNGVAGILESLSALAVDVPDIAELDINPLLVTAEGVVALDARVRITTEPQRASRLALYRAPVEWAATL